MTKKQKKNIPVHIILRDYCDDFAQYIGELGNVTPAQAQQIIDAFSKASIDEKSCIQTMSLEHKTAVQFGRPPFQNHKYGSIDIENLFYFDNMPKCTACDNKAMTEEKKYKTCHRNFRNGKCIDKNMREVLGKILYPQHYGKQKQVINMTIQDVLFTPIRNIGFNNRGICSVLETADTIGKRGDLFIHIINIPDNVYPKVHNVGKITIAHIHETLNNFIDKNHAVFLDFTEQDLITLGLNLFAVEKIKQVLAKRKLTLGKKSYLIASANKNIKNCQKEISDLKQQIKDIQTKIALKEIEIIQKQKQIKAIRQNQHKK